MDFADYENPGQLPLRAFIFLRLKNDPLELRGTKLTACLFLMSLIQVFVTT